MTRLIRPFKLKALGFEKMLSARSRQAVNGHLLRINQ